MQFDLRALTQKCLLGGCAGILAWAVLKLLSGLLTGAGGSLQVLLTGAVIGAIFAQISPTWELLYGDRSAKRAIRKIGLCSVFGAIGGIIGVSLGEFLFQVAEAQIWPRAIGWAVFGILIGATEGAVSRSPQKFLFGAIGGCIGGMLGGSLYEAVTTTIINSGIPRSLALNLGGAIGLTVLGMFIGFFTGFVEVLLRSAWLYFLSGRLAGQTRTLDVKKEKVVLGRSDLADISIRGDNAIAMEHVHILSGSAGFRLESAEGVAKTEGGQGSGHVLQEGDIIVLGETRARFLVGGGELR